MPILDRLFGRKTPKSTEGAATKSAAVPWGLIVSEAGDVCISVKQFGRPALSVSLVFGPEFHDEAEGISPLRLLVTYRDGRTSELSLAAIASTPGRETAQIEAIGRIARAPSVLLCETDAVGIANMHQAPVFLDEVVAVPPRRLGPNARSYAAIVLNVLDEGSALHEWKALVRIEDGSFDVGETFMTLYPAPVINAGSRLTVKGTVRNDGGRKAMQTCADAVLAELERLNSFSSPFHLEIELGGVGKEARAAARVIIGSTIAAMSSAGCRAHGYMEGTLSPYVRMLGDPFDEENAANVTRFAVMVEGSIAGPDRLGRAVIHPKLPAPVSWQVLEGPGDVLSLYIDSTSKARPSDAKLLIHDHVLMGRYGPASPVGLLLAFEDGSRHRSMLDVFDEDTLAMIKARETMRVVELHNDDKVREYEASVLIQSPEACHVPRP